MDNFYQILGVSNTANSSQIRAAYKKLALKFHPDRNPGFPEAEDIFKKVNEAYHTLSDPLKKINYDSRLSLLPLYTEAYKREMRRRRYWYYWSQNQDQPYKLDKEYFKIQGLAFLVFIVISGFCFALVHTAQYIVEQQSLKRWNENSLSLKKVKGLFGSGHFEDAFNLIHSLKQDDPNEFRFVYARDSLEGALRNLADVRFEEKDFSGAVSYYLTLKTYEQPNRFETIRKISLCQYYLGNYKEALQALKQLHYQRPYNLELVYQIGIINLDYLENTEEALHYFSLGKKLFKENLTRVYGAAFELIVNPADVPDIYYQLFEGRARCNLILKQYNEAVTDGNWAVFLRPAQGEGFNLRAQAYAGLNNKEKVCSNLYEARIRGVSNIEMLERKYCRH